MPPSVLEERAALEDSASVNTGGHCPYCGSDSVCLEKSVTQAQTHSPDGAAVITKQHPRCCCCDRSFLPQNRDWGLPCGGEVREVG